MATDNQPSIDQLESRLMEAFDGLWDSYVDPREAFAGDDNELWSPIGAPGGAGAAAALSLPQLSVLIVVEEAAYSAEAA